MAQPVYHENIPLIEVSDKMIMDTLLADRITAQYILNRISDRVAIVWPGHVETLLNRLRKQGHTPKVINS